MYNVDKIRRKEYPHLNKTSYLDYGGATPYAKSLVNRSARLWKSSLFGNPHSHSASSMLATEYVDRARKHVLQFFRADPAYFDVVFVANATAAIKLVGYSFQEKGFWYGYHGDSHTSMVGVREMATSGFRCFSSDSELEEWLYSQKEGSSRWPIDDSKVYRQEKFADPLALIAYPAQSNMNGHRTPSYWAAHIRDVARFRDKKVYTLLDAAAYCSSAQLDLSDPDAAPDFISLSFYKIFGMPDLGALIVRKSSSAILRSRQYFGGGTVDMVLAYDRFHAMKAESIHESLEDGTLPFHSLVMLDLAISLHKDLFHSMDAISQHASSLALSLYRGMSRLRHANGRPVCEIYQGPNSTYEDSMTQGPTVAFNVRLADGAVVPYDHVEALASACNIQIRAGGVCNPGGIAGHLRLASWEMRRNYCEGFRCGEPFKIRGGKPMGVVRASLGGMSCQTDVDNLVSFLGHFFADDQDRNLQPQGPVVEKYQQVWVPKVIQIFPVQHCPGWRLPANHPWELESTRLAMDGDWCLVNLQEAKVLDDPCVTQRLSVDLDIQSGKLRLRGDVHGSECQINVDLWELPTGEWLADSLEELPTKKYRLARQFTSDEIEQFLTAVFDRPVTLARFYEFSTGLPTGDYLAKHPIRRASRGIRIHFSEETIHTGAHIVLAPRDEQICSEQVPRTLYFGTHALVCPAMFKEEEKPIQGQDLQSTGLYYRRPEEKETFASQNTLIHSSDLVLASGFEPGFESTVVDEEAIFADYYFCPVVRCGEKRDDYNDLKEHLTSHAKAFVSSKKKSWRERIRQVACF